MSAESPALALDFALGIASVVRRRVAYAFRSFCMVYGYRVVEEGPSGLRIIYGGQGACATTVPARYKPRQPWRLAPAPIWYECGETRVPLFHGGPEPDWLGELFEWLAAADEHAVRAVDDAGRVPFAGMVFGRYGIDPTVPWAAVLMAEFNKRLRGVLGRDGRAQPRSFGGGFPIVATHDLDYHPGLSGRGLMRTAIDIAHCLRRRDVRAAVSTIRSSAVARMNDRDPVSGVDAVMAGEGQRGWRSTWFIIAARAHRRDARYCLGDSRIRAILARLLASGHEIGLHGSYRMLTGRGRARRERDALCRAARVGIAGFRAHWLRDRIPLLYRALDEAWLAYDSTSGFSDRVGFRNGCCFPYLPYDFRYERPHRCLEFPLVAMDVAVSPGSQGDLARVLERARRFGAGGIAVLWHDVCFSASQGWNELADLYWDLPEAGDRMVAAAELLPAIHERLRAAGLGGEHERRS